METLQSRIRFHRQRENAPSNNPNPPWRVTPKQNESTAEGICARLCDGWLWSFPDAHIVRERFEPSRYHPDQIVCSGPDCQRHRRTEYHRNKLQDDATYRAQCRDSQQQWREQNPDYMRKYRQSHPRPATKVRQQTESSAELIQLLESAKNNLAIDLKTCPARIFLISPLETAKNIVATAKIIVIEGLPGG